MCQYCHTVNGVLGGVIRQKQEAMMDERERLELTLEKMRRLASGHENNAERYRQDSNRFKKMEVEELAMRDRYLDMVEDIQKALALADAVEAELELADEQTTEVPN